MLSLKKSSGANYACKGSKVEYVAGDIFNGSMVMMVGHRFPGNTMWLESVHSVE